MLTISVDSYSWCDGVPRRHFLKVGALGMGGLMLSDLMRAEAQEGRSSTKALINIHLSGGPSHQDMWDLKPEAPAEVRGEFRPIPTNVAGMEICEHMPRLAKMADKYVLVRGMVGSVEEKCDSIEMTELSESGLKSLWGR